MGGGACPVYRESAGAPAFALRCYKSTARSYQRVLLFSQGRKWWMNTDEPWQALACCMEIAKASRSPDPAAYISHFPVHQVGAQRIHMAHVAERGEENGQGRSMQVSSAAFTTPRGQAFLRMGVQSTGILA